MSRRSGPAHADRMMQTVTTNGKTEAPSSSLEGNAVFL
jgi:hypothetical protein